MTRQAVVVEKPLTGRTVLIALLAFFGVVIGVNMLMMKLAIDTLPGTDVDSAYRASLDYAGEIKAAQAQNLRNWRVAAHVERQPDGRVIVSVEPRDASGATIAGPMFSARLMRPVDKREDHAVTLVERERGIFRGEATGVASGQWDLLIQAEASDGARLFQSQNRVLLK